MPRKPTQQNQAAAAAKPPTAKPAAPTKAAATTSTHTVRLELDTAEAEQATARWAQRIEELRDELEFLKLVQERSKLPKTLTVGDIGLCRYSVHAPHLVCPALVTATRVRVDGGEVTHTAHVTLFQPGKPPHPMAFEVDSLQMDRGTAQVPCVFPKPNPYA